MASENVTQSSVKFGVPEPEPKVEGLFCADMLVSQHDFLGSFRTKN